MFSKGYVGQSPETENEGVREMAELIYIFVGSLLMTGLIFAIDHLIEDYKKKKKEKQNDED